MDRNTAADEIAASDGVGNMFFHNKVSLVICYGCMVLREGPSVWRLALRFPCSTLWQREEIVHFHERNADSFVAFHIVQHLP